MALHACSFDSGPLGSGPGLEPPGGGTTANEGSAGSFSNPGDGIDPGSPTPSTGSGDGDSTAGVGGAGGAGGLTPPPPGAADAAVPSDAAVTPDAGTPDAGADAGDLASCDGWAPPDAECPAECTSCDAVLGLCFIDCGGFPGSCSNDKLECPPDWACRVHCDGIGSCNNGELVCGDGPCEVTCTGISACANWDIQCGDDRCDVTCTGIAGTTFSVSEGNSCQFEQTGCPP